MFLERRTYRRNRLQDAARLLPILGLMLIFAPIFIRDTDAVPIGEAGPTMGAWLIYYTAVWIALIVVTGLISRALVRTVGTAPDADAEADTGADADTDRDGP